ncbi:MAG: response regulator [Nitrospirae bacterium]|nr:response regulator [Nitrospirota bacterium]
MTVAGGQPLSVLVADDNPDILALFTRVLGARGHRVRAVATIESALAALAEGAFDLAFTELSLGGVDGDAVLARLRECATPPPTVILTGYAGLERALDMVNAGAHDYIAKPFTQRQLEVLADNVTTFLRLRRENAVLTAELADAYRLIGEFSRDRDAPAPGAPPGGVDAPLPVAGAGAATVPALPSREAIATYRAVAWNPERAADRIRAMRDSGALSQDEYERLSRLIPRDLPTV